MKALIISSLALVLSSCNILPKPAAVHDFGLYTFNQPNTPITAITRGTQNQVPEIAVDAPRWLANTRIYYRLLYAAPTQLRSYSMDRWIASPPELFQQLLAARDIGWRKPINLQLQVFEQQFSAPDRASVVMDFTVSIPKDDVQGARKREFHLQQPCITPDAKGAVAGFAVMTKQAAEKVKAWLNETSTTKAISN